MSKMLFENLINKESPPVHPTPEASIGGITDFHALRGAGDSKTKAKAKNKVTPRVEVLNPTE
jgi:hypothetical protein